MNKIKRIIFSSIIVFILVSSISIAEKLSPCLNDEYGLIYDTSTISNLCKELYSETGIESAIVIANFSGDIDTYALNLFEENKIGNKKYDTGFLIIINPENNDWIILVGYGLEGVLNDAKLADIGRTYLEEQINSGEYTQAIIDTYSVIGMELINSGEFKKEKNFWKDNWPIILGVFILIIILILTKGKTFFLPNMGGGGSFGGGRTGGGRGKR